VDNSPDPWKESRMDQEGSVTEKICEATGGRYGVGSFADYFHRFLEATPQEVPGLLATILSQPREPNQWIGGMTEELRAHGLASEKSRERLRVIEERWMLLGINLVKNHRGGEGLGVLSSLYNFLREYDIRSGDRWHKGTAAWHLADSLYAEGRTSESRSVFLLALIEDCFEELSKGATDASTVEGGGAFRSLSTLFDLPREEVNELAKACFLEAQKLLPWDPTEPERTYLSTFCRISWLGDSRPRLFPLLPAVASTLRQKALDATSPTEKGLYYEFAIAYLFETAGGFQACLRALGADAENDLIVLNQHHEAPLNALGDYVLVQSKNTGNPANAQLIREFLGRLQETNCASGVFLCRSGLTGVSAADLKSAPRVILKARQRASLNVLGVDDSDLATIASGGRTLTNHLIQNYLRIRFDLYESSSLTGPKRRKPRKGSASPKVSVAPPSDSSAENPAP
jgi:hypothetical protein